MTDAQRLRHLAIALIAAPLALLIPAWRGVNVSVLAFVVLGAPLLVGLGLLFRATRRHPAVRIVGMLWLVLVGLAWNLWFLTMATAVVLRASEASWIHLLMLASGLSLAVVVSLSCWRGVQLLRSEPRHRPALTRPLGAMLAMVALTHLPLALHAPNIPGSSAFHISPAGVSLWGFFGTGVWHVLLLLTGLVILLGTPRAVRYAAIAAVVLSGWVAGWLLWGRGLAGVMGAFFCLTTYLLWWFARTAARTVTASPPPSAATEGDHPEPPAIGGDDAEEPT